MLQCDQYLTPASLDEALQLLSQAPAGSRLLAGGTDTLPWARQGRAGDISGDVHVPHVVDLCKISELFGYSVKGGRLRLGAMLTMQQFLEDRVLREHLPMMPYCAIWFADDQIRRQATLVGNLVNASPAADGAPPMLALNGIVEVASLAESGQQRRRVPLEEFLVGPGRTILSSGDIVTAIECDSAAGYGGAFEKVGHRRSLVISVACATCCVKPSADGRYFKDVRLALGGVGPVPERLHDVEAFLQGKPIDLEIIAAAAAMPIDRVASRTRREYRRDVVRGFTERALIDALSDCGTSITKPARGKVHG